MSKSFVVNLETVPEVTQDEETGQYSDPVLRQHTIKGFIQAAGGITRFYINQKELFKYTPSQGPFEVTASVDNEVAGDPDLYVILSAGLR